MDGRYLGSDTGLARIQESANAVANAALQNTQQATQSIISYQQQNQQRAAQLLDLQSQLAATQAQAAAKPSGFAAALETGVKAYIGYEQQKREREQKERAALLVRTQSENELKATQIIETLERDAAAGKVPGANFEAELAKRFTAAGLNPQVNLNDYNDEGARRVLGSQQKALTSVARDTRTDEQKLAYGDLQVQLSKLVESEPGVERFRQRATALVADKMQYLSSDDVLKAMDVVNRTSNERYSTQQSELAKKKDELDALRADQIAITAGVKLAPLLSTISKLPPTAQAAPYIKQAEDVIKAVVSDKTLSEEQAFRIANGLLTQVQKAYGDKADAYAGYTTNLTNLQGFITAAREARAQFQIDNNLQDYNARLETAKAMYGDFRGAVAEPGAEEALASQIAGNINTLDRVQREALTRAGVNVKLEDAIIPLTAQQIIANPGLVARLESDPALSSNPAIKTALTLAKTYQEYEQEMSKHQEWRASQGVEFRKLNLSIAQNRAQLITQLARVRAAQMAGKTLSPGEQAAAGLVERIRQSGDDLFAGFLDSFAAQLSASPTAKLDPQQLEDAALLSQAALQGVINATVAEVETRDKQIYERYRTLEQYGLLKPRDQLIPTERQQSVWEDQLNKARQLIQEQAATQLQPTQYGQPPNFSGSSAYGASVDERGLVRVAPRQSLQVIGGVITPVLKGAYAPIPNKGGYKAPREYRNGIHAGVDFALKGGDKAVALVGGVAHVYTANGYGGVVDIIGDNGYVYRYAHQGALVKSGQRVNAGDVISTSNGSGVGAHHLHFEVHKKAVFDANGKYQPQFGMQPTVDPMEHLKNLTQNSSNVLQPKFANRAVARNQPRAKVPLNAAVIPQGGAIHANHVQFIGGQRRPASSVFNNQRPLRTGRIPWTAGSYTPDYEDDFGYAPLRNNKRFLREIHAAAEELKIPAMWIADVIRQEAGAGMKATTVHNGGLNYGLFGFGNDSFRDVKLPQMRQMDEVAQVKLMVRYMKENGWMKHREKRGTSVTIAEYWAIMRMGTVWRRRALADPTGFLSQRLDDTGRTWGGELELLGKWAGREYSFPGRTNYRKQRNAAVDNTYHASCKVCQSLQASATDILPHTHDLG